MAKINKKRALMLLIISLGIIFSAVSGITEKKTTRIDENNAITREEFGEGDYSIRLSASVKGVMRSENIDIHHREPTYEELELMSDKLASDLPRIVVGDNESLMKVNKSLNLITGIKEYPFDIRWRSNAEDVIDPSGKIRLKPNDSEAHDVLLTAVLSQKDYRKQISIPVRVKQDEQDKTERLFFELFDEVRRKEETNPNEKTVSLPSQYMGQSIIWKEKKTHKSIYILPLSFGLAFIISMAYEYDEKNREKKRQDLALACYPNFVEKMGMYLTAGLSVKNIFITLSEEEKEHGNNGIISGSISRAANKLRNGVREEDVYEEFAEELGGPYKKLSFLLTVNLRKGSNEIIRLLEEEGKKALLMRRDNAKRMSDKALVKMLFPMMLTLLVVMMVIMMPAYMNF